MMDNFLDKLMPFLFTIKRHPELASGMVFMGLTLFILLALLWVVRSVRQRSAPKPIGLGQEPMFASGAQGLGGGHAMSNRSIDELVAIEDSLKALRELYHRKLIPAEVYVKESKKYAESL